jgi:hypothetical protein
MLLAGSDDDEFDAMLVWHTACERVGCIDAVMLRQRCRLADRVNQSRLLQRTSSEMRSN